MSLLSAVLQTAEAVEEHDHRTLCAQLCPRLREASERARNLGCALREHLLDLHVQHSLAPARYMHDYQRRACRVRSDCETLAAEAEAMEEKGCAGDGSTDELKRCSDDLRKAHEFLTGLSDAVEASEAVSRAGVAFRRADYENSIYMLDDVRKKLASLKLEGEAGTALKNLKRTANAQRALYATQLGSEWEDMLSWSERCGVSHLTYSLLVRQSDVPHLHALLHTLYSVHRLHDELAEFSEFFITKIVTCIINNTCEIFTDENVNTIILNIKFDRSGSHKPSFQSIFNNLTAVLEFIQSTMDTTFSDGHTFITVFSGLICNRFFDKLISDCVKKYLPDCDRSYQQYKLLTVELDTFNKFLIDMKFVSNDRSPLNQYMENSSCILYKKKCDKLLMQVRCLLSESLIHSTAVVSGEAEPGDASVLNETEGKEMGRDTVNRPLFLPHCIVSENVRTVLTLVVEHVNESCKLPESYSFQFVGYVKDVVVLYQTLVPSLSEVNLKKCPLDIALFFNNCFYLAHGLMGAPWRVTLPEALADALNTTLAPALTDLRTLGLHYLSHYLREQKALILATVRPDEPVVWDYESFEAFDKAVTRSMATIRKLRHKWLGVLPAAMYEQAVSTMTAALCQAALAKVFSAGSHIVAEDVVLMLAAKFEALAHDIKSLYADSVDLSAKMSIWKKFFKMAAVLSAQMLELATLWEGGAGPLAPVFTCEEIRHVIKMRFPDDGSRLAVLAAIQ